MALKDFLSTRGLRRPLVRWLGASLGLVLVVALAVLVVALDTGGRSVSAQDTTASCDSGTAISSPADKPGLVRDCETLLALKDTLRGSATLNWSAERSITSWSGVTVAGTPRRVTRLDFRSGNLNGTIPAGLGDLSALTELDLGWNRLTGAIPAELGNLTRLEYLNLGGNRLSGAIPPELGSIGTLTTLTLSGPRPLPAGVGLTGSIPPELGYLSGLQSLYLDGNRLTGTIPTRLARLTNLTLLHLARNQLSGPIPTQLGNLAALRDLRLEDNSLTGAIPTQLDDLTNLGKVYLKGNSGFTGCLPRGLSDVGINDMAHLNLPDCAGDAPATPATPLPRHTLTVTITGTGTITPAGTTTHDEGSEVTLTASWNDARHYFQGWSGACSGVEGTTCTLSPFDDDATVSATFAERCTGGTTDPTCIRVVYQGAPGDYANVSDIPENRTFTRTSEGRYQVGRGEQITVVTAAPLPAGWTRFYLQWSPLEFGTPSPLSFSRLIPPVGTTYTFTPTTDTEGATLITFDLTAARPFIRPRPDNKPELGNVIVTTKFEVVSCDSGVAVTDPTTNTELVEDCKTLLALKDTLAGTATLNWSPSRSITDWEGITLGGTPRRVTKLELADSGLTGEIPPALGDLTALTALRLSGNQLTGVIPAVLGDLENLTKLYLNDNNLAGVIPASLEDLTNLTHAYLADNDELRGCVPGAINSAANNDLASLDLNDCEPPQAIIGLNNTISSPGTYRIPAFGTDGDVAATIPTGITVKVAYNNRDSIVLLFTATEAGPNQSVGDVIAHIRFTHEGDINSIFWNGKVYDSIIGDPIEIRTRTLPAEAADEIGTGGTIESRVVQLPASVGGPTLAQLRTIARSVRPVPREEEESGTASASGDTVTAAQTTSSYLNLPRVRNFINGESIEVCSDIPSTTMRAMNLWNGKIAQNQPRVTAKLFVPHDNQSLPPQISTACFAAFSVHRQGPLRVTEASDAQMVGLGCFDAGGISYGCFQGAFTRAPYWSIYYGRIYIHDRHWTDVGGPKSFLAYVLLHELGHAWGAGHVPCGATGPTSVMIDRASEDGTYPPSQCNIGTGKVAWEVPEHDRLWFNRLYDLLAPSNASARSPNPKHVRITFDARHIQAAKHIRIERNTTGDPGDWSSPKLLGEITPNRYYREVFTVLYAGQPTGQQYYRIIPVSEAHATSTRSAIVSTVIQSCPSGGAESRAESAQACPSPQPPPVQPPVIPPTEPPQPPSETYPRITTLGSTHHSYHASCTHGGNAHTQRGFQDAAAAQAAGNQWVVDTCTRLSSGEVQPRVGYYFEWSVTCTAPHQQTGTGRARSRTQATLDQIAWLSSSGCTAYSNATIDRVDFRDYIWVATCRVPAGIVGSGEGYETQLAATSALATWATANCRAPGGTATTSSQGSYGWTVQCSATSLPHSSTTTYEDRNAALLAAARWADHNCGD